MKILIAYIRLVNPSQDHKGFIAVRRSGHNERRYYNYTHDSAVRMRAVMRANLGRWYEVSGFYIFYPQYPIGVSHVNSKLAQEI